MKMISSAALLSCVITLTACGAQQEPDTPGEKAARQAAFLEFTKLECAVVLGGSGVKDLTVASAKLQKRASDLGVVRDYSIIDTKIATAWAFSVGMQGRMHTCNQFISDSYQIMSSTDTL